jgi:hypothetical protein
VLVRPDLLTSLLCVIKESLLFLLRAPKDIRLDWTPTESLLGVIVVPPHIMHFSLPRPVLPGFLFVFSLGQNQVMLLIVFLLF